MSATLLGAGTVSAADIPLPPLSEERLSNGLRVVVAPRPGLPLASVRLVVDAGSSRDPRGREGLADWVGTLLRRGTKRRTADQIDEAIERVGGVLEVQVSPDSAALASTVPCEHLGAALDVLADVVSQPSFPERELRAGTRRALAALQRDLDDPSTVADRAVALEAYGAAHPYGHPVHGFVRTVRRLGARDAREFHRACYAPGSSLLLIVGDVEVAPALRLAREKFGRWQGTSPAPAPVPPPPDPRGLRLVLVDKEDATQTQIRIAAPAFARDDGAWFPALVANTALGGGFTSTLVDEIRVNRGLSYRVGSRIYAGRGAGIWVFTSFTKNETVRDLVEVAFAEIEEFRESGPTPAQMEKAKRYLTGQYPQQIETHELLARALGDAAVYGLGWEYISRYPARIAAAEAGAAARALPRFLATRSRGVLVAVGRAKDVKAQLETFGPVEVVPVKRLDSRAA